MGSPTEAARAATEQATQLAAWLRAWIRYRGALLSDVSVRLGMAPAYLNRVFAGDMPLKLAVVFGIFPALGEPARHFFDKHYPRRAASGAGAIGLEGTELWALRAILEQLRADAPERSPSELVERTASLLLWKIDAAGKMQMTVSEALGLSPKALGKALRKAEGLTAWQLFGTLHALGIEPGEFFAELLGPEPADFRSGSAAGGAQEWYEKIVTFARSRDASAKDAPPHKRKGGMGGSAPRPGGRSRKSDGPDGGASRRGGRRRRS